MVLAEGVGAGAPVLRAGVFRRHARAPGDLAAAARGVAAADAWRWAVAGAAVWRRGWVLACAAEGRWAKDDFSTLDSRSTTHNPQSKVDLYALGTVYSTDINAVSR